MPVLRPIAAAWPKLGALMLRGLAYIAMLLIALPGSAAAADGFDFRGSELGMSLPEWKALPAPPQLMGPARPVCTDEFPGATWAHLTDAEKSAGVIACIYAEKVKIGAGTMDFRTNMRIGDNEITGATYQFLDGRLYSIELVAQIAALGDIETGLRDKFGPPVVDARDTTQNGLGVTLPHRSLVWRKGDASIVLDAPWLNMNGMLVLYTDGVLSARIKQAGEALHPGASKM
ncbi:MAG TPA: hypothetical protein VL358_04755 [Caulobacteraceae bacterium]|nr:hypothetical protein [Caulobacteraceae bacterium]